MNNQYNTSKQPSEEAISFPHDDKHSFAEMAREKIQSLSRSSTLNSEDAQMKDARPSTSSSRSSASPKSQPSRKSTTPPKTKPTKPRASSGTFSDCGRHSNQWLFNNVSITDAVKTIFEK